MTPKRRVLAILTKTELLDLGRQFELEVASRMTVEEVVDVVAGSKRATLDQILPALKLERLRDVCDEFGLARSGGKPTVLERLAQATGLAAVTEAPLAPPDLSPAPAPTQATAPRSGGTGWLPFASIEPPAAAPGPPLPSPGSPAPTNWPTVRTPTEQSVNVEITPRKPRLAWMGMDRRPAVTAVPTQVVEIVWPGRSLARQDQLGLDARHARARDLATVPPNRLIWTNDNLVALRTLLDERDPSTGKYRYRGNVDLIYIDPPFMVNSDFRAENTIDIEIDEDAGVHANKEPSLVEILAYKDTWRQGLDSFLSMLRGRLELLKELLAPTGSIYVHLDWHASHYVRVLMDDIFGYENFQNEIVWQRTSSHNDPGRYGIINDTLLLYSATGSMYWGDPMRPPPPSYFSAHDIQADSDGRLFRARDLTAPHLRFGETGKPWRGLQPADKGRCWSVPISELDELDKNGMIVWPKRGEWPRLKVYLSDDRGIPIQSIWSDVSPINSQAGERLGYPTQKPIALLDRIISASSPPGGLVLDCFLGSGTTAEAAERLGRRWIGIDNGKYGIHLSRKRLIQLHGQPRPPEKPQHDYVECAHCKNIERKEKAQRSPGPYSVQPFTVENMGVYQRAEAWQGFQIHRSRYRDEMIKVFGGEVAEQGPLLHGTKDGEWIHVGPLDGPVSVTQVWSIAREAAATSLGAAVILSADFNTLSNSENEEIQEKTGVRITIRVIPASALDEIRRRIDNSGDAVESMAIPAFYAPLSIRLDAPVRGRLVNVRLVRCEVDIQSFLASQRPAKLEPVRDDMSEARKKKLVAEHARWEERRGELKRWLAKARTWEKFVDFWAIDWDYGRRPGPDGKPIFETQWQSFRTRQGSKGDDELSLEAEFRYEAPGVYRVAARVTDVFGNDGIATVTVDIR